MVFLVFIVVVLTVLAVVGLGPSWVRQRDRGSFPGCDQPPTVPSPPLPLDALHADSEGEREERRRAEHLLAGSLPIEQYQQRMADLAVQDARHQPLVAPPDDGDWSPSRGTIERRSHATACAIRNGAYGTVGQPRPRPL